MTLAIISRSNSVCPLNQLPELFLVQLCLGLRCGSAGRILTCRSTLHVAQRSGDVQVGVRYVDDFYSLHASSDISPSMLKRLSLCDIRGECRDQGLFSIKLCSAPPQTQQQASSGKSFCALPAAAHPLRHLVDRDLLRWVRRWSHLRFGYS